MSIINETILDEKTVVATVYCGNCCENAGSIMIESENVDDMKLSILCANCQDEEQLPVNESCNSKEIDWHRDNLRSVVSHIDRDEF